LPSLSENNFLFCFPTIATLESADLGKAEWGCKYTEHTVMEIRPQVILTVFELKFNNVFCINELLQKLWILINYSACPGQVLKYTYISKFSDELFVGIPRMK
jgi:hypothetical protein